MAEHPVTPMTEADLRRHLGKQTDRPVTGFDVRAIERGAYVDARDRLRDCLADDPEVVLFDGIDADHQRRVGRLVWEECVGAGTTFAVGSSGLDYALCAGWRAAGALDRPPASVGEPLDPVDRIAVVSGSASPVNAAQIDWALDHGFAGIRLDTAALVDPDTASGARAEAVDAALGALGDGASPLLYSARGPDDPAIERTTDRAADLGVDDRELARRLGTEQGRILRAVVERGGVQRACVAGGDTSGYAAPALDVYALEFGAPVGPGSPLCRAAADDPATDGLELALKGGQVQTTRDADDFFGAVRDGGVARALPGD